MIAGLLHGVCVSAYACGFVPPQYGFSLSQFCNDSLRSVCMPCHDIHTGTAEPPPLPPPRAADVSPYRPPPSLLPHPCFHHSPDMPPLPPPSRSFPTDGCDPLSALLANPPPSPPPLSPCSLRMRYPPCIGRCLLVVHPYYVPCKPLGCVLCDACVACRLWRSALVLVY